MIFSIKSVLM